MDDKKLAELRDYYDTHDTAEEMAGGEWITEVDDDPMVTTSLRLPKSVLDKVRAEARARGIKPTALMREWIEANVNRPTYRRAPVGQSTPAAFRVFGGSRELYEELGIGAFVRTRAPRQRGNSLEQRAPSSPDPSDAVSRSMP